MPKKSIIENNPHFRNCPNQKNNPKCESILYYSSKYALKFAADNNRCCKSCSLYGKKRPPEVGQKISEFRKGKSLSIEHKQKISKSSKGRIVTDETRKKLSEANKGSKNYFYGKGERQLGDKNPMYGKSLLIVWVEKYGEDVGNKMWIDYLEKFKEISPFKSDDTNPAKSEKHRKRMREMAVDKRMKGIKSTTNPIAIPIIEKYGIENGYEFRHGKHSDGEFYFDGYFADGYDQIKNVWIEYDEKSHYSHNKLKPNDIVRQEYIIKHLKCKFIRIKYDNTVTIIEYECFDTNTVQKRS